MRFACSCLGLALALPACGDSSGDPQVNRLAIQPPADTSCIGVSGFVIEVSENGSEPRTFTSLRSSPVLSRDDCRIEQAATFSELADDVPLAVTIRAYDGGKQLRLQGSALLPSLRDAGSVTLSLAPTGVGSSPVIAIDRARDVLAGNPVSSISEIELSVTGQLKFVLPASEDVRPFFEVGEPWAIAFPGTLADGDDLNVKVTLDPGGVVNTRLAVTSSGNGDYFVGAPPGSSHP